MDYAIDIDDLIKYVGENFHDPIHRNKERYKERPKTVVNMKKAIMKSDLFFTRKTSEITKGMTMFD